MSQLAFLESGLWLLACSRARVRRRVLVLAVALSQIARRREARETGSTG